VILKCRLNRTIETAQIGTTLGTEIFTDLDFANDVALLSEMLVVLITAMEIMHEEASLFGMEIIGQRRRSRLLVFETAQPLCK